MRISYNWLRQYVEVDTTPEELSQLLTSIGLEVEAVDYLGKQFDGFVVGEVIEVQKHPNADRLKVCAVVIAPKGTPLQIVCGAPNVAIGQKVAVGTVGATVPHNQHDPAGKPFVLSNATIRGVESSGMICSEKELGIGPDSAGIKVLEHSAVIGTPLADYLGLSDVAFEIGITPNRPDCLSHLGIARDLSAVYHKKLQLPVLKFKEDKKKSIKDYVKVTVENRTDCPRYTARMIHGITVGESPEWLKRLLTAAGLRPINNVVDATNYVMLEYGQPLHAFDYDTLAKSSIVVKNSKPGEPFTSLDGRVHTLNGTELMICDGEKAVAIGGVMGGLNSEISSTTTTVLLEAAYFSPVSIRKTAKRMGMSTDASYRFERGVDPNITAEASARAACLIAELTGGRIVKGLIDVYPKKIHRKKISLRGERVNAILGTRLSEKEIRQILSSIGLKFIAGGKKGAMLCEVPTYRPDIEQEIDLIEEVARVYGYDNIENKTSSEVMFSKPERIEQRIGLIRSWCEANGLNEVVTNSLTDKATASLFSHDLVKVRNPLSAELEILRPTLMTTMLQSVAFNYNHGATRLHFYEIGNVFSTSEQFQFIAGFRETPTLAICLSGYANPLSWHEKQRNIDIFDIKGIVTSLLESIGLDNRNLIYYNAPSSLTEMTIGVEINSTYVGFIGRCKNDILQKYKIEKEVFYAELNLDALVATEPDRRYKEFSKFPTVNRDVAFIVDRKLPIVEIENELWKAGGMQMTSVTLFDVFEGKSVGEGKKSVAFSLSLNSAEKTLTDKEIDDIIGNIVNTITKKFDALLRSL